MRFILSLSLLVAPLCLLAQTHTLRDVMAAAKDQPQDEVLAMVQDMSEAQDGMKLIVLRNLIDGRQFPAILYLIENEGYDADAALKFFANTATACGSNGEELGFVEKNRCARANTFVPSPEAEENLQYHKDVIALGGDPRVANVSGLAKHDQLPTLRYLNETVWTDHSDLKKLAVHTALSYGSLDVVKFLHEEAGVDLSQQPNSYDSPWTPFAASAKFPATVAYLIEIGLDMEAPSEYGGALFHAIQGGCVETMDVLLAAGADPTAKTVGGVDLLTVAKNQKYLSTRAAVAKRMKQALEDN